MLEWNTAIQLVKKIEGCKLNEKEFLRLKRELKISALNYARARTNNYLGIKSKAKTSDQSRTQLHNEFIVTCDNLSQYMAKNGAANSWRVMLGNDRKVIGDFACYLHCAMGLHVR